MRISTNKRILDRDERLGLEAEALVAQIRERARNLYLTRQLLCTEAVMVALNHGLKGGLTDTQAVAMAAPFSTAMGERGKRVHRGKAGGTRGNARQETETVVGLGADDRKVKPLLAP